MMATLSYAADLGLGQPMAHCMRQTVVALRLASLAGASDRELEATYYLGLMMNVYCHADAAEQARWFGDDISLKGDTFEMLDMSTARMVSFLLRRVGSHGSGVARARRLAAFPVAGVRQVVSFAATHCTLGAQFAGRIGLDEAVCVAIGQAYEQWDGKGYPNHLRGEEICLPARLVQLAGPVEVFARRRGVQAAVAVARRHRGTQFDPAVVDLFCERAPELLDGLDQASDWDAVLGTEPQLSRRVAGPIWTMCWRRWLTWFDLKSPYLAGHSRGVANLASEAARVSGHPGDDVRTLRRAGLIHDLGRARGFQRGLGQARPAVRSRVRAGAAASLPRRRDAVCHPARPAGRLRAGELMTKQTCSKALRILEGEGLFARIPGLGYYVC